jgi:predicted nucleotidyltransferase
MWVSNMVRRRDIRQVCARIAREFHPRKIILFGSYAYGRPSLDSDVDLLVIMPFKGRSTKQAIEISKRLDHRFPIDLVVRTPEEVRQRLVWSDFFLREATQKGVVMYESVDCRYPGVNATKADAKQALRDCRLVRKAARLSLGLPI